MRSDLERGGGVLMPFRIHMWFRDGLASGVCLHRDGDIAGACNAERLAHADDVV